MASIRVNVEKKIKKNKMIIFKIIKCFFKDKAKMFIFLFLTFLSTKNV